MSQKYSQLKQTISMKSNQLREQLSLSNSKNNEVNDQQKPQKSIMMNQLNSARSNSYSSQQISNQNQIPLSSRSKNQSIDNSQHKGMAPPVVKREQIKFLKVKRGSQCPQSNTVFIQERNIDISEIKCQNDQRHDESDISLVKRNVQYQSKLPPRVKPLALNKENLQSNQLFPQQSQRSVTNQKRNYSLQGSVEKQIYMQSARGELKLETPTHKEDSKNKSQGLRQMLRDVHDSAQKSMLMSTQRTMSSQDSISKQRCDTLECEALINMYPAEFRKKQRKSCLKKQSTIANKQKQSYYEQQYFKKLNQLVVTFSDNVKEYEDLSSQLNEIDYEQEEIDKNYRKFFKSDEDEILKEKDQQYSYYENQVYNMKESEYWKVVFERLTLKFGQIWDYPITKLDVLLEREFYEYRNTYLIEEDIQSDYNSDVTKVEGLQKQNEDLQKEIEDMRKREKIIKKVVKPSFEFFQEEEQEPELSLDYKEEQEGNKKDKFEESWNNFNKSSQVIGMKITNDQTYDQSFSREDKPMKSFTNWEENNYSKLNQPSNEPTQFVDFNDSFCQQVKGFIQQSSSKNTSNKKNDSVNKIVQEYKPVTESNKKEVISKQMKDFESYYAKYEEKLKIMEQELQDYNIKSKQLEEDHSPNNNAQKNKLTINSPKVNQLELDFNVNSPTNANYRTDSSLKSQETPTFHRFSNGDLMKRNLAQ